MEAERIPLMSSIDCALLGTLTSQYNTGCLKAEYVYRDVKYPEDHDLAWSSPQTAYVSESFNCDEADFVAFPEFQPSPEWHLRRALVKLELKAGKVVDEDRIVAQGHVAKALEGVRSMELEQGRKWVKALLPENKA